MKSCSSNPFLSTVVERAENASGHAVRLCRVCRDAMRVDHVSHLSLTLSPYRQPSPFPLLERVNQSRIMPRAASPESESESERIPSKKQKKREESPVDDPMDEDDGEEAEYEIEAILDSSKDIFPKVCSIHLPWLRGNDLNVLTGNCVLCEVERL